MSIIYTKNNKGGVGKSWLTLQLAHATSLLLNSKEVKNKVLIVTTDSQNNILDFALSKEIEIGAGLESWVAKGDGDLIRLRDNLEYIPLGSSNFTSSFKNKIKATLYELKDRYDYIFIDAVPVAGLDKEFEDIADKIIIPAFMDVVTLQGVNKILETVNINKVKAIIPNRFNGSAYEKKLLAEFRDVIDGTKILLTNPVPQTALISNLISKNKTIWETSSKRIEGIQETLGEVLEVILSEE
ncbi:MAG: ParA family protein [Cetobacterium sp.]